MTSENGNGSGTGLALTSSQQTGLTLYDRVEPMEYIDKVGKIYALTGAGGAKTESDGKLLALACLSRRMDVFELAQTYHLISGKLVKKADVMLGEFRRAGGRHRWIKDGTDGQSATLELTPKGESPSTYTFTMEMARAAGYVKKDSQWEKRPDQMLRARCITDLIGMVAPELKGGDITEDEVLDVTVSVDKQASTAPARSAKEVAKRQTELQATANGDVTAATSTDATANSQAGEVVDAEFTVVKDTQANNQSAGTPNVTTSGGQTLEPHQEQSLVMEIELTVGQIPGSSVASLLDSINKRLAAKNEAAIASLDQLDPTQLTAILTNLRGILAKKQQAPNGQMAPTNPTAA